MAEIFNIRDRLEFVREVAELTQAEWGAGGFGQDIYEMKVQMKVDKIMMMLDDPIYCKLVLVDGDNLIGFISIFPQDCDARPELSPWYSTMFVKEEFRGRGYSRLLNDAILDEARMRGILRLYLTTTFTGYYERFGAKFLESLDDGVRIYYFDI